MQNLSETESHNRLIFVYNADSGLINMLKHWTHKLLRPQTYDCQLCLLTYGNTGMHKQWDSFISSIPLECVFLHRDEFIEKYPTIKQSSLPCILIEERNTQKAQVLVDATTINAQKTLQQLIEACSNKIKEHRCA